jgi:hypothetical protein
LTDLSGYAKKSTANGDKIGLFIKIDHARRHLPHQWLTPGRPWRGNRDAFALVTPAPHLGRDHPRLPRTDDPESFPSSCMTVADWRARVGGFTRAGATGIHAR